MYFTTIKILSCNKWLEITKKKDAVKNLDGCLISCWMEESKNEVIYMVLVSLPSGNMIKIIIVPVFGGGDQIYFLVQFAEIYFPAQFAEIYFPAQFAQICSFSCSVIALWGSNLLLLLVLYSCRIKAFQFA